MIVDSDVSDPAFSSHAKHHVTNDDFLYRGEQMKARKLVGNIVIHFWSKNLKSHFETGSFSSLLFGWKSCHRWGKYKKVSASVDSSVEDAAKDDQSERFEVMIFCCFQFPRLISNIETPKKAMKHPMWSFDLPDYDISRWKQSSSLKNSLSWQMPSIIPRLRAWERC